METKILSFEDTKEIINVIMNDGVIAFPTETVYGLGVKHDSFLAYKKIFSLKKRNLSKSLTLMLSDVNQIGEYGVINDRTRSLIDQFMPGALTLILPIKKGVDLITNDKYIGIRVPDSRQIRSFLASLPTPLYVTSANISKEPDCLTFNEVQQCFDGKIDAIIKGDVSKKQASTVVKIDDKLSLLRQGPIAFEKIKEVYDSEKNSCW